MTEPGMEPYDLDRKKAEAFRQIEKGVTDWAYYGMGAVVGHSREASKEEAVEDARVIEEVGIYVISYDRPLSFDLKCEHPAEWKLFYKRAWAAYNVLEDATEIIQRIYGKKSVEAVASTFTWAHAAYFVDRYNTTQTTERAIAIEMKKLGPEHPVYLEHLIMIGEMKLNDDDAKGSIKHLEEAIGALESQGDDARELLARALQGYAIALREVKRLEDGENASFRYTALLEEIGKGMTEECREAWIDLAETRFRSGDLTGADEAASWALSMGTQIHGGFTVDDKRSVDFLVDLSVYRCDLARARDLQTQLIQTIARSEGERSPKVDEQYLKLVDILLEWQHNIEALHVLEEEQECELPDWDIEGALAVRFMKRANYFRICGDLAEADSNLNTAIETFWNSKTCDTQDLHQPTWLQERFAIDQALGKEVDVMTRFGTGTTYNKVLRETILGAEQLVFSPDYAEIMIRSSIAEAESEHSWEHLSAIEARTDLSTFLIRQGQLAAAEIILNKNVRLLKKLFGDGHPELARTYRVLTRFLMAKGQLGPAEGLAKQALTMDTNIYGGGHLSIAEDYMLLSDIQANSGDVQSALLSMGEALGLHSAEGRVPSLKTVKIVEKMAPMMASVGMHEKAFELLEVAKETCERDLGKDHPRTHEMNRAIASIRR